MTHVLLAHATFPNSPSELWSSWAWEPGVLIPLLLSVCCYAHGVARFWHKRIGVGIHVSEVCCFAAGWLTLGLALVSPLHPWGRVLFSAHMTQHELLMLVAAPLLVLSRPLLAFLKALPGHCAHQLACFANTPAWSKTWLFITYPFSAWAIHGLALWIWHVPALFQATLDNEWVHALQHSSFFFTALLFWWAVLQGKQRAMGYGAAVIYMFTTALHSGLLGALITFAGSVLYPAYNETTRPWGLTPLEDQQLGGLIMWIPAGLVYVVSGLVLFAGWLKVSERRALAREAAEWPRQMEGKA
jgi:putative membrane protein